jgi:hypothetical protein
MACIAIPRMAYVARRLAREVWHAVKRLCIHSITKSSKRRVSRALGQAGSSILQSQHNSHLTVATSSAVLSSNTNADLAAAAAAAAAISMFDNQKDLSQGTRSTTSATVVRSSNEGHNEEQRRMEIRSRIRDIFGEFASTSHLSTTRNTRQVNPYLGPNDSLAEILDMAIEAMDEMERDLESLRRGQQN